MMKALREVGKLQEQMQQLEVGWLCVISQIRNFDVQDMIISRFFFLLLCSWKKLGRQRLKMYNCRRKMLKLRGNRESCKYSGYEIII